MILPMSNHGVIPIDPFNIPTRMKARTLGSIAQLSGTVNAPGVELPEIFRTTPLHK